MWLKQERNGAQLGEVRPPERRLTLVSVAGHLPRRSPQRPGNPLVTAIAGPPEASLPKRQAGGLRPKDAATLIIVDRSGAGPLVLMGRRHAAHKFMAWKYVFPGGRVEPEDRRMCATGALHPAVEEKLNAHVRRPSASFARAIALDRGARTPALETEICAVPAQAYPHVYPAWMKKFRQSSGWTSLVAIAQALQRPSSVRLASLRRMVLNLAKACSIGSRSGL